MNLKKIFPAAFLFVAVPAISAFAKWELVWSDEFNGSRIDGAKWTKIDRGKSDWNNYMSHDPSLYAVKNGNLILRGKVNPNRKKDPVPFITGGISSAGKFAFRYGKIEIRAKLDNAKGAWPAFWLLPDSENRKWPDDGEIDIMEHLNFDDIAYQTVHSRFTHTLGRNDPPHGSTGKIDKNGYNIYAVEWNRDKLVFSINGKETFAYPRVPAEKENGQWPFTTPFYILLDMQVEGSWVGKADPAQYPIEMKIDWVRVYQNKTAEKASLVKTKKKQKKIRELGKEFAD